CLARRWIRVRYAGSRRRADCTGDPDMGTRRRLDRTSAQTRRADSTVGAVFGRVPCEPRFSGVRGDHRTLPPEPECLAQPADDPRNPMVHPVQCHRGCQRIPDRPSRGRRQLPPQGMAGADKSIPPGVFSSYGTGAITASGGSWNASIVAEVASWGDIHLTATGLGAYIATATEAGDFPRVVLGIAIMCVLVTLFNRLLWRPLYPFGEPRLRLG